MATSIHKKIISESISSHHLSVYVLCQLMGDTLITSFNESLSIDFKTLSRREIYKPTSTLEIVVLSGRIPHD
jgi:hypothetical protein